MNGFRTFLAAACLAGCLINPASAEPNAKQRGWEVLSAAREAIGSAKVELRDYSCSIETRLSRKGGPPIELKSTLQFVMPELVRQDVETPNGKMTLTFDGERAVRQAKGEETEMLPGRTAQLRGDLARANVLLGPAPSPDAVRFLRSEKVDDREADVIEVQDVGDAPVRLYIDAETRDMLKMVYVGDIPGGGMAQVEEFFSDYVEAGGIRWHRTRRVIRNGEEAIVSKRDDFVVNTGLTMDDIVR